MQRKIFRYSNGLANTYIDVKSEQWLLQYEYAVDTLTAFDVIRSVILCLRTGPVMQLFYDSVM